jgi:hypothetical protein
MSNRCCNRTKALHNSLLNGSINKRTEVDMRTRSIHSCWPVLALVLVVVFTGALLHASAEDVRLILAVDKSNYDKLESAIRAANGDVAIKFKYVDAMAVSLPFERLRSILSMPEVLGNWKDRMVTVDDPKPREIPGYGTIRYGETISPEATSVLAGDELAAKLKESVNSYYPYGNQLINAYAFSQLTQHFGENVIIAIIDGGVSRAARAVAGAHGERIVGTANMSGDGIDADDPGNYWHGTAVACCAGANATFWFNQAGFFPKAVERYAPGSVITGSGAYAGLKGVPMVGPAPFAKFYAIKVYPADGGDSPWSVWAAGLEKAIELKEAYNNGAGGCNIQIANMSFGNINEYAANDPLFAPLVKKAHDIGIVLAVAAGNGGPTGLSILSPGDCRNILTAGATDHAIPFRIAMDLANGVPGIGGLIRPVDNNLVAWYSSRGPTADGRYDPDIVAPGTFPFVQVPNGNVTCLVTGTSFAAPTVAGAAALLLSAHPGATPDQIRGALLNGANPKFLSDTPAKLDQGYGFLDVLAAQKKFGWFNPVDWGLGTSVVRRNVLPVGITVIDADAYSGSSGWLLPGQRKEFYVQTTRQPLSSMTVKVDVTPESPFDQQNQFVGGDDAIVTVATAMTSFGNYLDYEEVWGSTTVNIDAPDLDFGLTRVTVMGDNWNVGRIKADVSIMKDTSPLNLHPIISDVISEGDWKTYTVTVPEGASQARFVLAWINGWEAYPTDDLDMYIFDPNGAFAIAGARLSDPERATLVNPVSGTWTILVNGFTVWQSKTDFKIFSEFQVSPGLAKKGLASSEELVPGAFVMFQNYPNPFNPSTVIKYGLPVDAYVHLGVYNILGEQVASVVNEPQKAGYHQVVFENTGLSSGTYFYRLQAGNFVQTRKLVLVR